MVLLLSWDAGLPFRDRVTVAPITTNIRGINAEVFLDESDGLYTGCVVNLDVMQTVMRSTLRNQVTELSPEKMTAVEEAIHRALGIALPCPHGQLADSSLGAQNDIGGNLQNGKTTAWSSTIEPNSSAK